MAQPLQWRDSAVGESWLAQSLDVLKQKTPLPISNYLFTLIKSTIAIAIYLYLIYFLGWQIMGLTFIIFILKGIATYLDRTTDNKGQIQGTSVVNLRKILCDLNNQREIQLYQAHDYLMTKWKRLYQDFQIENLAANRRNLLKSSIFTIGSIAFTGVLIFYSSNIVLSGVLGVVDFIILVMVFLRLSTEVPLFITNIINLVDADSQCQSLFTMINMESSSMIKSMDSFEAVGEGFQLHNVCFAYPGSNNLVLQNISCVVKPGETVAIVGENGAGKSTLAKLLLGLYQPTSGTILLDGEPVTNHKNQSAVFQDYMQYHLSVRENIGFGDLSNLDNDQLIFQAAKKAGALEVIRRKRLRLEDTLGDVFGGTGLSGGEWQSIATARGFMGDKEILLIDEPTASLDPFKEIKLIRSYLEHTANKLTIIISHRLLVASLADKVLVLKDGKLTEIGSHSDLLHKGGYYWELWHNQTFWYDEREVAGGE